MILLKFVSLLLLANGICSIPDEPETELVLVQLMFRHGVRSILLDYPNDTQKGYWDKYGGYGQLTPVGMKQLYDYSQFIKLRYSDFLSPVYKKSKVYARSTDYDRTLQSCYSFLTGLFKPSEEQTWNPNPSLSEYLPIPVHTSDLATDNILHANAKCPRYDELRQEMRSTPEYLAMQEGNKEFLDLMVEKSGLTNMINNQYMIWQVADKAMVEEAHQLDLDDYITENYQKIMELNDYTFYIDFVTDEMGRLISGGLLNDIVKNINKKVNGSTQELYIYGVHDNYVAGMQKLLKTSETFVQPGFASGFVFELRKDAENNYFVKVFYKNNKYPEPDVLETVTVNGCEELCPLETFLSLTKDHLVTDFTEICKSKPKTTPALPKTTRKTTRKTTTKKRVKRTTRKNQRG